MTECKTPGTGRRRRTSLGQKLRRAISDPRIVGRAVYRRAGLRRLALRTRGRWRTWYPHRRPRVASLMGRLRRERVVHVLHIRKTGGTALKDALATCPKPTGVRIVFHGHSVRLTDIPPRDEVVFFVRDPVTRFVSGFNGRLREGRPRYNVPLSARERRALTRFPTPDDLALGLYADDPSTRHEAHAAMREVRNVGTRLADWLGDAGTLMARRDTILLAGWTDTLSEDFQRLKALLGLSSECRLPTGDSAHRAPETQTRTLSDSAVANLRRWFADDEPLLAACRELAGRTHQPVAT